jgi:protein SCO1/2
VTGSEDRNRNSSMSRAARLALPLVVLIFGMIALGIMAVTMIAPKPGQPNVGIGGAFSLIDHEGRPVTEKALLGSPSVIFFGFTHCPDVCPTALFELSEVYKALGPKGDRLKAFFVTVDPERDTPELLKTYLSSFDPRITGLTGTPERVQAALKAWRAYARKVPGGESYTMDHTSLVYLMDAKGRFVSSVNLDRPPAETAKAIAAHF